MTDDPAAAYRDLLARAGLSHAQAAELLDVSPRRSRRMSSGMETASPLMLATLALVAEAPDQATLLATVGRLAAFFDNLPRGEA